MRRYSLYCVYNNDAATWLRKRRANSIHAVVTDPPFGLLEYTDKELANHRNGAGVWRLPNQRDGAKRQPTPRFTVLTAQDRSRLRAFVLEIAAELFHVLVPGGHVFWASHPLFSHIMSEAFTDARFEKRGEIIRTINTLRGGDRPKGAHDKFPSVCVLPKSCWQPWLIFRKPLKGRIQDNLKRYGTGGLRRISEDEPFRDLIVSAPASRKERCIARHPSLKPQAFMRQLVHAALPTGKGVILDPFMGSGSTIAAALHQELHSIGVERSRRFYKMAIRAIPKLAAISTNARIENRKSDQKPVHLDSVAG